MLEQRLDGLPFRMKEPFDFGFVSRWGRVFRVFDDQDSGNICFGTERDGERFFLKYAGAPTARYEGRTEDAAERLRPPFPAAKASASGWRHRSAPAWSESYTFWTSQVSGCISGITTSCSQRCSGCGIWGIPSLLWNMTRIPCGRQIISLMWARERASMAARLSAPEPRKKLWRVRSPLPDNIFPGRGRFLFRRCAVRETADS